MKDSIYIKILEYGENAGINGLHHDEILEKLKSDSLIEGEIDLVIQNRITSIFHECFEKTTGSEHNTRLLKTEYLYRLVEFRELEESRKASKSANRYAFLAIGISVLAIIAGIASTITQLNSSISINSKQIRRLAEASKPPVVQNVTISKEQLKELVAATMPPKTQVVAISQQQLVDIVDSIDSSEAREMFLSQKQMQMLLQAINFNKAISADAKSRAAE